MTHEPLLINKFTTGLVQSQPNQILKNDAFHILFNAFVFRNTVRRRLSWQTIGRLQRDLESQSIGTTSASPWSFNIYSTLSSPITGEPDAAIVIGSIIITIAAGPSVIFTDNGDGTLSSVTGGNSGTINYSTGNVVLTHTAGAGVATTITFSYYPSLPSMGILDENVPNNITTNIYFDTKYAYTYVTGEFTELQPGTTWKMNNWNLPSNANYWQDVNNRPIFWVTSNTGSTGDPIRYTNGNSGSAWYDFTPAIDATNTMYQCKFLVPFRGMLFAFNTWEGTTAGGITLSTQQRARIRCSAGGNPFTIVSPIITTVNSTAWNSTIPGQGYRQDLPTTEEIIAVGQTLNQIIIKTNTRTWVLSHTGINVAPFKVDLLDENLGTLSGFGSVNMGGSLTGVGNRSFTASTPSSVVSIDDKILDLVLNINRKNHGFDRVYGVRDYITRTNSYIYAYQPDDTTDVTYPNRRLIYNYDNNSWAIYEDSLTCLGYFRDNVSTIGENSNITWAQANFTWAEADFTWANNSTAEPPTAAGNNQGYIGLLDSSIIEGPSLFLTNMISTGSATAGQFISPDHNLANGTVIQLQDILGDYSSLNETVGQVQIIDTDTFMMFTYDATRLMFRIPVVIPSGTYIGGGQIRVRRNFNITTKAFNRLEQGQSIHISYVDALVNTYPGAYVQLAVYDSLNTGNAVNLIPENITSESIFGNKLSLSNPTVYPLNEINNRALINQRANMITLEFSLDNATMASDAFSTPFVLSSMTVWNRSAGRPLMPFGGG